MAQGLMGLSNLLGQSSNTQSGGLFGGGVFSQPESRGQRRSRLLTEAISGAGQNPYARLGASFGGLIGMGGRAAAEGLGIVDAPPEVQQAEAIRQVQQEVAEQGLDPMANPREFGDFVANRFQELGQPQLATRSLLQARQIESQFAPEPQERRLSVTGGSELANQLSSAYGVSIPEGETFEVGITGDRVTEINRLGSATNVTVEGDRGSEVGTIPQGYELVTTESGARRLRPIPGGPVAREAEQAEEQAEGREELEERAGEVVFEDIERLTELVQGDSILDPVLGLKGVAASQFPGTKRVDAENLSETIKANIGFDRLQQMREASPTGGALGQVSNQELNTLQSVLGNLSFAQSEDQLVRNLNRLKDIYSRILEKEPNLANPNQQPLVYEGSATPSRTEGDSSQNQIDFSNMSRADLLNLNIDDLSESQLREYNSRLDTLLQGGN